MGEKDPTELADQLQDKADDLERHSAELGRRTEEVAQDWQRKRSDESVPGAPPPESEDDDPIPTGSPTDEGDND